MTNVNLFDALEICLQALEKGADVESCLALFPALAEDLRPLLTAAVQAKSISVGAVPDHALRRGKARVLQAAAEMRSQGQPVPVPFWRTRQNGFMGSRFFRLAVTTAVMLVFLLTGGTGLVNASNKALPGDRLYPVKRSWEGVRLFFVTDPQVKAELEDEFDHERVQEIEELYTEKRVAQVNFQGVVQSRNNGIWVVGGLNVAVNEETSLSAGILPGAIVQVLGETDDGIIKAEHISLIAAPGFTPFPEPSSTPTVNPQPEVPETPEPAETPEGSHPEPEETPELSEPTEKPEKEPEIEPTEDKTEKPEETKPGEEKTEEPRPTEQETD